MPCELVTITGPSTRHLAHQFSLTGIRLHAHRHQDLRRHHRARASGRAQRILDDAVRGVKSAIGCFLRRYFFVPCYMRNVPEIRGLIDYLLGSSTAARDLRRKCAAPRLPCPLVPRWLRCSPRLAGLYSNWCPC